MIRKLLATAFSAAVLLGAAPGHAMDVVTFQCGWLPGGDRAPVYIGAARGMFAKENIEVKILSGRGSGDTLSKLANNVADIGESGFDAFLAAKAETPVPSTAVMPFFTKTPDVLVVNKASGLTSLSQMSGKSVATSPFTSSNLTWPLVLKMAGVDPDKVKLIKADPATLGGMLAAGQVDAVINWVTSAQALKPMLATAGKEMHVIEWSREGYDSYSQAIIASDKFIKDRPEVLRKFMKVFIEATKIMIADPKGSAENIKQIVPQVDVAVMQAQLEAAIPLIMNEVTQRDGLGKFNPELVQKSWGWAVRANGYAPDKIDPMKAITGQFIGS